MIKVNQDLFSQLVTIGWQAADKVLAIYQGTIDASNKADGSPITQADLESNAVITQELHHLFPTIPLISEEDSAHLPPQTSQFWLIDPLDGTKEFINRNGEFTINIALIEDGAPIVGMVCAPALHTLYIGGAGYGAFKFNKAGLKESITVAKTADDGLHVVGSRSHADETTINAYLAPYKIASFTGVGSSLKFCQIAEGQAHLYPRLGPTMEWDTAAGHALLNAAGGEVKTLEGKPMHYGKKDYKNPHFVATSQRVE